MPRLHCQSVRISPLLPMILPLGLWLLCSFAVSQEICSSPGTLPAPQLFLRLSAHQGDRTVLSCLMPCGTPVTRIVFCKDGKEISVQPREGNKLIYDSPHPVSRESEGAFSCRYQFKDDNNQENNSLPSEPQYLHVADEVTSPTPLTCPGKEHQDSCVQGQGLILGLAVVAGLVLGLLGCFLMKKVVAHRRTQRNPGPNRSSPASEDHIEYAVINKAHTDRKPRMHRDVTVTYEVVGQGGSQVQDIQPAP